MVHPANQARHSLSHHLQHDHLIHQRTHQTVLGCNSSNCTVPGYFPSPIREQSYHSTLSTTISFHFTTSSFLATLISSEGICLKYFHSSLSCTFLRKSANSTSPSKKKSSVTIARLKGDFTPKSDIASYNPRPCPLTP